MNAENKQVLEMLAEGKITAEDAERLLEKLSFDQPAEPETASPAVQQRGTKLKYLRVHVDGSDGEKVNIRVPLALIRAGIKLTAVLPDDANEKLRDKGVDLSKLAELETDELFEALRELQVDVDGEDGETVRIFCE